MPQVFIQTRNTILEISAFTVSVDDKGVLQAEWRRRMRRRSEVTRSALFSVYCRRCQRSRVSRLLCLWLGRALKLPSVNILSPSSLRLLYNILFLTRFRCVDTDITALIGPLLLRCITTLPVCKISQIKCFIIFFRGYATTILELYVGAIKALRD